MAHSINILTKITLKLLMRNKGFIILVFVLPILATLLLNLKITDNDIEVGQTLYEIDNMNKQIAYFENYSKYPVIVYDQMANRDKTLSVCEDYAESSMFEFFISDSTGLDQNEIEEHIDKMKEIDKFSAVIWYDAANVAHVYQIGEDDRFALLTNLMSMHVNITNVNEKPKENRIVTISDSTDDMTEKYKTTSENFGYTVAIITALYLFTGVIILFIIIQERQSLVLTRITLSNTTETQYMISKLIVVLIVTVMQTLIMGFSFGAFVKVDVGVNIFQFMLIVFSQGLIFDLLSVSLGSLVNNILNSCYMSFVLWSLSAMLAGLYFPLNDSGAVFQTISKIMPQKWALQAFELFMTGDNAVYPMMLCVTSAYLIVILVIGIYGMKINKRD